MSEHSLRATTLYAQGELSHLGTGIVGEREEPVDEREVICCRRPRRRGGRVGMHLLWTGGPGDDARECRAREQPAERRLEHGDAPLVAERLEPLELVPRCLLPHMLALAHD